MKDLFPMKIIIQTNYKNNYKIFALDEEQRGNNLIITNGLMGEA